MANTNKQLQRAKREKNDEFYTRYEDIEKELSHYDVENFRGKIVYCPCDDIWSNFWKYFVDNFERLELKGLIASHYEKDAETVKAYKYDGREITEIVINGDGDFRSPAVEPFWQEADLIITNPPFSLFREFIAKIMEYE